MKSVKNTLKALSAIIAVFLPTASGIANAAETAFSIGVPGSTIITPSGGEPDNVSLSTVSTADIDSILSGISTQQFGQHYTRDLANDLFGELSSLKSGLNNQLSTFLANEPAVQSVNSITTSANPIDLSIRQLGTSLGASVYGISVDASIDIDENGAGIPDIPFCTPEATFTLKVDEVRSTYNVYTGSIQGTSVFYRVVDEQVSCDNILGQAFLAIGALFTDVNGLLVDKVEDAVNQIEGSANAQDLFSVKDFLDSLREVVNVDPLLIGDLRVTSSFSFNTDFIIDKAQALIEGTNLDTGLQLDLKLYEGSTNQIELVVGHQELDVIDVIPYTNRTQVSVKVPEETTDIRIYACSASGCARLYDQIPPQGGGETMHLRVDSTLEGRNIIAIAESTFISGLESRPGKSVRVGVVNSCGQRAC